MKTYTDEKWRGVSFPYNPDAYAAVQAITQARIEGKELNRRRPSVTIHLMGEGGQRVEVKPQLDSSPTGWEFNPTIKVICLAATGKPEMRARLYAEGQLKLARWKYDEAANYRNLDVITKALDVFAAKPMNCFIINADNCGLCGKALTDPESRDYGIGPECRKSYVRMRAAVESRLAGLNQKQGPFGWVTSASVPGTVEESAVYETVDHGETA